MKLLKLVFMLVIVVGVVIGILWLSGSGGTIDVDSEPLSSEGDKVRKEIVDNWSQVKQWDADLFNKNLKSDIRQNYGVGNFRYDSDTLQLRNILLNEACNKVYDAIFAQFNASDCNKGKVNCNYQGVNVLKGFDSYVNDPRILEIENVYKVYNKIDDFVNQKFAPYPSFDGQSWRSYQNIYDNYISQRNSYSNDPVYKKYLSNIIALRNGLNNVNVELDKNRYSYYKSLYDKICDYYASIKVPDVDEANVLQKVFERFSNEISPYKSTGNNYEALYLKLMSFKNDFKETLDNHETIL